MFERLLIWLLTKLLHRTPGTPPVYQLGAAKHGNAEALFSRGLALHALKRYDEAVAHYDEALTIKPDFAEAWSKRGFALHRLKRHEDALASCDKALTIKPNLAPAWSNRGVALYGLGRDEEALASYDRALTIQPDFDKAWNNRGIVLHSLKRYDEALASYDNALTIKPKYAEAWSNRGSVLQALKRYDEALANYDNALTIKPDFAEAWSNRGIVLHALKRHDEALASYDRALTAMPDYPDAHFNLSLTQLSMGDFERGWQGYEWRWKLDNCPYGPRDFSRPSWDGTEDIAGMVILLHAEQGLGDTIQFARYAKLVAKKGATVLLQVQPSLKTLMGQMEGVSQTLAFDDPLPEFDFHCTLMSLPLAFATCLETVPCEIPYLFVEPRKRTEWESRLGRNVALRIGLAWSGKASLDNGPSRSVPLALLIDAMPAGVELYSLQKDVHPADQAVIDRRPDITHFGENFVETAALAMHMDLVISVDTAIAHLAGALGRPIWILLPYSADWRWLKAGEESPWYPTARLFRQPTIDDWDSVMDLVKKDLAKRVVSNLQRAEYATQIDSQTPTDLG